MARRRAISHREPSDEATINLTPLIDVVFVVLIMFIIVAPLLELDRVALARAASKENKELSLAPESSALTIHVRADDSIWFQSRRISEMELPLVLKQARKQYPQKRLQLYHDKKGSFGVYQTIKNAVEGAGFEELDVILQPN